MSDINFSPFGNASFGNPQVITKNFFKQPTYTKSMLIPNLKSIPGFPAPKPVKPVVYANMNPNVTQIGKTPFVQPNAVPRTATKGTKGTKGKSTSKGGSVGSSRSVVVKPAVTQKVDPLEALRGEYDKYLQDMYSGLVTSLQGDQAQYKTRSDELAARLAGYYDQANTSADQAGTAAKSQIDEYASRMGLQQAQPGAMQDWVANNERIKAQNASNRASSVATNDIIRSNYYDFLGDKIMSAKGQGVTAEAGLNDVIAQAILARQQAAVAAAAAASRRRSGGGRGGRGGGSKSKGGYTSSQSQMVSTNDIMAQLAQTDPLVRNALMAQDPTTSMILNAGLNSPSQVNAGPYSGGSSKPGYQVQTRKPDYYSKYLPSAMNAFLASGKSGGPVTKTTTKLPLLKVW